MRLVIGLVCRLIVVSIVCLACAVVWAMVDAHRTIERETSASAERVGRQLEALYWRELLWRGGATKERLLPTPEWRTLETLALISPGVCVDFSLGHEDVRRLCGQVAGVGSPAPDWFGTAYDRLLGPHASAPRALSARQHEAGAILASAEPGAAVRLAWGRVSALAAVAAAMAAATSLFSALAIAQALAPAQRIIAGLRRLSRGDYRSRIRQVRAGEFAPIGAAVNELAERLGQVTAERIALMRRLIEVRDEERVDLARELHDEFGQLLTAAGAFAAAIEAGSADRPELAADARAIGDLTKRMGATLRGALARLHNPVAEERGLEASLLELVAGCNALGVRQTAIHLDVDGDLTSVPERIASGVYRIAQECLTNALRHGTPSEVRLRVERTAERSEAIVLTVEDDGGGDVSRIAAARGRGITGIRERIGAFGGELSIGRGTRGVRVNAIIPLVSAA